MREVGIEAKGDACSNLWFWRRLTSLLLESGLVIPPTLGAFAQDVILPDHGLSNATTSSSMWKNWGGVSAANGETKTNKSDLTEELVLS